MHAPHAQGLPEQRPEGSSLPHAPAAGGPTLPLIEDTFRDYCWWFHTDYLVWWIRPNEVPVPLVTLGTPTNPGAIGQPGTHVLIGDQDVENGTRQGGR